ncbi:hypothetical protein HNQ59_003674 [Chitinivorax tropicus]|uniref:Uncharacterized protein n=1 Tax=Chitinivorax tropicus TaxID=714531 RepID=A0A840MSG4_9PROT|nr:hypothetical protein [Chitinivorax tropicus]MBB5020355.1 hypothetical protein [Chitinivorax tropicus]
MKKHGKTIKPRDVAALALVHCKGGAHQKSKSAIRQSDKRDLRREAAALMGGRQKGSKEPFLLPAF